MSETRDKRSQDQDQGITQGPVLAGEHALPISTRNGVPTQASDRPGGLPERPDPDTRPHPAKDEGKTRTADAPANEPPHTPPKREAQPQHQSQSSSSKHK